jgi:hypothetical protein
VKGAPVSNGWGFLYQGSIEYPRGRKEGLSVMNVNELAEYLRTEGVEVLRILNQTTHRPGQPDVVVAVGLELGNDLCLYQYRGGRVTLYQWMPDGDGWVEEEEFETAQVGDLVKAIRGATR